MRDELPNEISAGRADLWPDIVQHHRRDQTRTRRRQPHRQQPAKTGTDRNHTVQVQRGARIHRVAQAAFGGITPDLLAAPGAATPGIIQRHGAAAGIRGNMGEIAGSADQPRQAQQRQTAIRHAPFQSAQRQPVPRRQKMNYGLHCASSATPASCRRAR